MKRPFIVTHDYGSGGIIARIFANSPTEIRKILSEKKWKIFEITDKGCPEVPETINILESDIEVHAPWLQKMIYIEKRQAEGKKGFPVRGKRYGIINEDRYLWARSMEEIKERFPSLEFRYNVSFPATENSDIDVKDRFITRYESRDT